MRAFPAQMYNYIFQKVVPKTCAQRAPCFVACSLRVEVISCNTEHSSIARDIITNGKLRLNQIVALCAQYSEESEPEPFVEQVGDGDVLSVMFVHICSVVCDWLERRRRRRVQIVENCNGCVYTHMFFVQANRVVSEMSFTENSSGRRVFVLPFVLFARVCAFKLRELQTYTTQLYILYSVCIEYAYLFYRVYRMSERMVSEMVSMLPPPTAIPTEEEVLKHKICALLCWRLLGVCIDVIRSGIW